MLSLRAFGLVAGSVLFLASVPELLADDSEPTGAVAHGNRAESGLEMWSLELLCLGGGTQTPISGSKVCEDAQGKYSMCSTDGECAGIDCCTLVLRLGADPGLPAPGVKGDCLSCVPPLAGVCGVAVHPAVGQGSIRGTAACD